MKLEALLTIADFDDRGEVGLADAMNDPFLVRDPASDDKVEIWGVLFWRTCTTRSGLCGEPWKLQATRRRIAALIPARLNGNADERKFGSPLFVRVNHGPAFNTFAEGADSR